MVALNSTPCIQTMPALSTSVVNTDDAISDLH